MLQCAKTEDSSTATTKSTECTSDLSTYTTNTYTALCTPEAGAGKFFVVQGVTQLNNSGFVYIFAGYSSTPTSSSAFAAGQYALVSGRTPTSSVPMSVSYFRNATAAAPAADGSVGANGINTPDMYSTTTAQEICAEFVPSTTTAPRVIFWVTGQNGANCSSRTNLTQATALINYAGFSDTTNVLTLGQAYIRMNNTTLLTASKVIVSSKSNF